MFFFLVEQSLGYLPPKLIGQVGQVGVLFLGSTSAT